MCKKDVVKLGSCWRGGGGGGRRGDGDDELVALWRALQLDLVVVGAVGGGSRMITGMMGAGGLPGGLGQGPAQGANVIRKFS